MKNTFLQKKYGYFFRYFASILKIIENSPLSPLLWVGAFAAIISLRLGVELYFVDYAKKPYSMFLYEVMHTTTFFLTMYLLLIWWVAKIYQRPIGAVGKVFLWGFFLIILPPVIDAWVSGGRGLWSFYLFGGIKELLLGYVTFFGPDSSFGITYGVRAEVILGLLLTFLYGFLLDLPLWRCVVACVGVYSILFFGGAFPSLLTIVFYGPVIGFWNVTDITVAQMFLTPEKIFSVPHNDFVSALNTTMSFVWALVLIITTLLLLFFSWKKGLRTLVPSIRPVQIVYHTGLLLGGLVLATIITSQTIPFTFHSLVVVLLAIISVWCAWWTTVIVNDYYDYAIDIETNFHRPLVRGSLSKETYALIGWVLFSASLVFALIVSGRFFALLLFYHSLAHIYNAPPFRLKRIPFVASGVSALASLVIFFAGYLLLAKDITTIPFSLILLLFCGFAVSICIKDFKDFHGDKKDGVYTIPVLLGPDLARHVIGGAMTLCYAASTFVLGVHRLFFLSIFAGVSTWWAIVVAAKGKKLTDRTVHAVALIITAVYVVVVLVFLGIK